VALPFSTEAMEHLMAADPVMEAIVERVGPLDPEARTRGRPGDSYGALVRSITGQQLSVKAARTIYLRLADLYGGRTPTPAELIATDPDDLRAVGLSYQKAAYLRDLAERVEDDLRVQLPHATIFTHLEPIEDPKSFADTELDRAMSSDPERGH